jgi:3-oxoacyl-[acyl-carrier protein] reductase
MRLSNKVAIVTGAASGFGEGIAKRFAAEGARVVVNDVNADAGERVVRENRGCARRGTIVSSATSRTTPMSPRWCIARSMPSAISTSSSNNAGTTHRKSAAARSDRGPNSIGSIASM